MLKIAICKNINEKIHSTSWIHPWEKYCQKNEIEYDIIDPSDYRIIDKLKNYDILLWYFNGYSYTDMLIARSILFSAKNIGLKVFPDFNDCWHFDDKIAETYLLESINADIPKSFMFYNYTTLQKFADTYRDYPIVGKLRNGSGAHNVRLIKNKKELLSYGQNMFGKGISSSPSLIYKAKSNIKSTKSIRVFFERSKRIPEFLRTLKNSRAFLREKGYIFLQEYVENDGYDLKVVVVGDKLSFIGRNNRKNDFRASGGGDLFFDKRYITDSIINSAFEISDKLGSKCMGFDYVIDNKNGRSLVIEISYGFSHEALLKAGGYFDRQGIWHDTPLNAPFDIIENILKDY